MRRVHALLLSFSLQLFLVALTQTQSTYYRIDLRTREEVLIRHRQVRQFFNPTDPNDITWDEDLEAFAFLRAKKISPYCAQLPHDPNVREFGENLYFSQSFTAAKNGAKLVLDGAEYWRDELVTFSKVFSSFAELQRFNDAQRVDLLQRLDQEVKRDPNSKREFGHAQVMGTTRLTKVGCSYYKASCGAFKDTYFVSCLYGDGNQLVPREKSGYEELPAILDAFRGIQAPEGDVQEPASMVANPASPSQTSNSNPTASQNANVNNPEELSQRSERQVPSNAKPNCSSKRANGARGE